MKRNNLLSTTALFFVGALVLSSCNKYLDEPKENTNPTGQTDYTVSSNMILPLVGTYQEFNGIEWECFPLISVRGDDVNAGGLGDVEKADQVFYRNEIQPLQQRFLAINDWLGIEVVRFRERAGA